MRHESENSQKPKVLPSGKSPYPFYHEKGILPQLFLFRLCKAVVFELEIDPRIGRPAIWFAGEVVAAHAEVAVEPLVVFSAFVIVIVIGQCRYGFVCQKIERITLPYKIVAKECSCMRRGRERVHLERMVFKKMVLSKRC